jgi:hypothetical protein
MVHRGSGPSREDLITLIESSTREIPATQHRNLHRESGDFVRWGRRGPQKTLVLYGRPYFSLLASGGAAWSFGPWPNIVPGFLTGAGRDDPLPRV